ncbi:hypothetical protein EVAR_40466_1 [Eumeta japonica]|uniref:Uncharacterized protein n=1 Tax=Eumeta variegata TaxID=151549 RepID=A0A4C1X2A5_EUMVA|nr:hypothetical protein EVAR_40466_1 [Eumeta japonica]
MPARDLVDSDRGPATLSLAAHATRARVGGVATPGLPRHINRPIDPRFNRPVVRIRTRHLPRGSLTTRPSPHFPLYVHRCRSLPNPRSEFVFFILIFEVG